MTKAMTEIIAATRLLIRGPILRHWMLAFTFVHARSAIIAIKTKLAKIPGIHVGSGPQSSRLYLTAAALAAATAAYRITRVSTSLRRIAVLAHTRLRTFPRDSWGPMCPLRSHVAANAFSLMNFPFTWNERRLGLRAS